MVFDLSLGAISGHPKHKKNGRFRAVFGTGKRVSKQAAER
jgi:hypothetical protein